MAKSARTHNGIAIRSSCHNTKSECAISRNCAHRIDSRLNLSTPQRRSHPIFASNFKSFVILNHIRVCSAATHNIFYFVKNKKNVISFTYERQRLYWHHYQQQ